MQFFMETSNNLIGMYEALKIFIYITEVIRYWFDIIGEFKKKHICKKNFIMQQQLNISSKKLEYGI
jgi:hypothetical protein